MQWCLLMKVLFYACKVADSWTITGITAYQVILFLLHVSLVLCFLFSLPDLILFSAFTFFAISLLRAILFPSVHVWLLTSLLTNVTIRISLVMSNLHFLTWKWEIAMVYWNNFRSLNSSFGRVSSESRGCVGIDKVVHYVLNATIRLISEYLSFFLTFMFDYAVCLSAPET